MLVPPKVTLSSALSVDGAWTDVIRPWLERATQLSQGGGAGCVVVSPTRGLALALKHRALESGIHLLGIHFWSPSELREHLLGEVASRDALRLLVAAVAEEMELSAANDDERRSAAAIARAPDAFLQAFEQLETAGWNPLEHLPPTLRPLARAFSDCASRGGLQRASQRDHELEAVAASGDRSLSRLLIVGFDGAHWNFFPLLTGAARCCENADVVFTEPREEARIVDALWIGSWEQKFAATSPVSSGDRPRPMAEVLRLPESRSEIERRIAEPASCVDFLVAETVDDLGRVITSQVLLNLMEGDASRIGIVFPRASALSRLVSLRLAEAGVYHNDALGHPLADAAEDSAWSAWLRMQDDRRVAPFTRFIEECGTVPKLSILGSSVVSDRLKRELDNLLIDDLRVLAEAMAARTREPIAMSVAAGLRELAWLPDRAPVNEMYSQTLRAFEQLGWRARAIDLRRAIAGWIGRVPGTISLVFWLQWIREVLAYSERQRIVAGRHPYARVQLLSFADAAPLEWSHVILVGLNEDTWPLSPDDEGWLSEPEIVALNARALNVRAVEQGRHGEGHESVRAGHTWCLTNRDARAILQRQFFNLVENASTRVTATATMRSAEQPERISPPGELFARLYFCARGRAISPAMMGSLQAETLRWINAVAPSPSRFVNVEEVKETRNAWNARRAATQPFGEFEFALKTAPPEPLALTATAWENVLKSPALVFLNEFLDVSEPDEVDADLTAKTMGNWVHRWLARIAGPSREGAFRPLSPAADAERIVREAALADRTTVESLLARCGRRMPDWWLAIWSDALATALTLARKIPAGAQWTHGAAEYRLGDVAIKFPDGGQLRFHGRVDLLLVDGFNPETGIDSAGVWIVDYKTSDPKPLKAGKLAEGDGLQLALYGLAIRDRGTRAVFMSRLGPSLDLDSAQLTGEDLNGLDSLWEALIEMQESGKFGMLGELRSAYGRRATYPLATLAIDPSILDAKWALTHPKLNGGAA